jgi:hypothetical protein
VNRSQNVSETLAWLRAQGFLFTGERAFVPFTNWAQVLDAATEKAHLWYHAPLDYNPACVLVRRVFRNGKIRLQHGDCSFTADEGHLSRFRMRGVVATPLLPQPRASAGVMPRRSNDKANPSHIETTRYAPPTTKPGSEIRYSSLTDFASATRYDDAYECPGNALGRYVALGIPCTIIGATECGDYATFEQWASDLGYDSDSRSAATYLACLAIGLALRAGIGDSGLATLQAARSDY